MQTSATLITSLVYSRFPGIEFADLVDELDAALAGKGRWDGETNAIFEVEGSRMVIGFEDHRPQPDAYRKLTLGAEATLILSIGPGPDHGLPSPLEPHRYELLSALAERINRACPCDFMLWSETEEVFEPALYAPLVALSAYCNADQPSWADIALPDAAQAAKWRKSPPRAVTALVRRFQTLNLTVSPVAVVGVPVVPQAAAVDAPHQQFINAQPEVMPDAFADIPATGALPPDLPMMPRQASLPQRLTIYLMNATLMLVALPVGCAVVVYNMVRGEDLRLSARAIAVTGTLIGLAQLAGLPNAMVLV